jgi:hypothetical protein
MSIEAMRLALETLKCLLAGNSTSHQAANAITALRQAIEQAQQAEPVAWVECDGELVWNNREAAIGRNLYTAPPQREWQGLTDEEVDLLEELYAPPVHPDFVNDADHCLELIRHVEAKLKEKNT